MQDLDDGAKLVTVQQTNPPKVTLDLSAPFPEADRRMSVIAMSKVLETEPGGKMKIEAAQNTTLSFKVSSMLVGGKSISCLEIKEENSSKSRTGGDITTSFNHYFHLDGNPTWPAGKYITSDGSTITREKDAAPTSVNFDGMTEASKLRHVNLSVQLSVAALVSFGKLEVAPAIPDQKKL